MSKIPLLLPWLLAAASVALAAEDDLAQASRLRAEAGTLRAQAEERLRAAEPVCYERVLVNRCLAEAKDARLDTIRKARALEAEASRIELAHKRREAADREAERASRPNAPAAPSSVAPPGASTEPPAATPSPVELPEAVPDAKAAETLRAREAAAERAAGQARARQQDEDAEKARERAAEKVQADRRAEEARRDRERYDERIRRREQEKRGD